MSSNYQGRHAANVNRFAGLNVAPSPFEMEQQQAMDSLNFEGDFFDTEWLDAAGTGLPPGVDFDAELRSRRQSGSGYSSATATNDLLQGDFQLPANFAYPNTTSGLSNGQPDQFSIPALSSPTANSPMSAGSAPSGTKRKIEALNEPRGPASLEEATRMAAEEDKRRRNTAASARFRVKKKQREQALEKSAKEMTDKVNALEKRIQDLEMENKWLKGLITEKNGSNTKVAEMYSRHKEDIVDSRKEGERNDGVGTEPKDDEQTA